MSKIRGEWSVLRMKKGFTLIELLVVIAIIAILAAIIFPVYARAKDSAYRGSDMANMNSIRTALQLYRTDQGAYPPAILGYATSYSGGQPSVNDVIPANEYAGALYPKRIDSLQVLKPAYVRPTAGKLETDVSRAVWPSGLSPGASEDPGPYQRFGPTDGWVNRCEIDPNGGSQQVVDNYYYRMSGYDAALVPDGAGGQRNELRYTLFWSAYAVPLDPCNPDVNGSAADDPRQLGYTDPPDSTVITWDSYFREYENGGLPHTKRDLVLFLGGSARPYDSAAVAAQAWKVLP
jgi:prepilin-type N-terminal cleavage/methylation domain-containing protein